MRANALVAALAGVLSATVVTLAACASTPHAGAPGESTGESLYRSRCGSCHRLHDPAKRTAADWEAQVGRMSSRAHLSDADRVAVLDYLRANAKDAQRPAGAR